MNFKHLTSIAAAAVFGFAATAANAQGGYGALSYFDWSVDEAGAEKIESETVRATGGYMFNRNFGIEGHVATGGTDELQHAGEDAEAELNKMAGLFAKLNLPLAPLGWEANLYGLLGYGYARVDILAETTAAVHSENSFAWGAGADVALVPDRLYLVADYVEYVSRTGVDASAASVGLRLSFSGQ